MPRRPAIAPVISSPGMMTMSTGRLVAYVLNFTPVWNPDWGGMLLFTDERGHVEEGYVPVWNALNLMKVPQTHAVSLVAPFAGGLRYSITGWLLGR